MTHFDAEALAAYADGVSPCEVEIEAHAAECALCAAGIEETRALLGVLRDRATWPPEQLDVLAFAEQSEAEYKAAGAICEEILAAPPSWRAQHARVSADTQTAGIVRELLMRMRATLEHSPVIALQMTALAIELAEAMESDRYPRSFITNLRGQAFRDHAFVLAFAGRYRDAIDYADRADALLGSLPAAAFERARVAMVRANAMHQSGQGEEAARLLRQAAMTFRFHRDERYVVKARLTAGALLFNVGNTRAALEIWRSLEGNRALDEVGRIRLTHNLALCLAHLDQAAAAVPMAQLCVTEFERLGLMTERTRSRGLLGHALLGAGRPHEAIPVLRVAREEYRALQLPVEGAITALDLADALLTTNQAEEVPAICRAVIADIGGGDVKGRLDQAIALLNEALAGASQSLLRAARQTLREGLVG